MRLSDGSPAWPTPASFPASPPANGLSIGWVSSVGMLTVVRPAVFVAAGTSVTAVDALNGTTLWTRALPEAALLGPPVVSSAAQQGSTLYVAGASGQVYVLDSTTGANAGTGVLTAGAPITGTLALAGDVLYVPTASVLVGMNVNTGAPVLTSPLSAASGVAVAGGLPYVATADGQFVGFAAGGTTPPPAPPPAAHDLAITAIEVDPVVSRSANAAVYVHLTNRGTTAENYRIFLRLQPGGELINDYVGSIAAGETKRIGFIWPTFQMGGDGSKTLESQVTVQGQTDGSPADNTARQPVTVGP
jgi:hypothetical protein